MAIYTDTVRAAAARAADWLEANRDKHITIQLALTADGHVVPPADPRADCFCALGRLAKELDINDNQLHPYDKLDDVLGRNVNADQPRYDYVYEANDADADANPVHPFIDDDDVRRTVHLAGTGGIIILRKIANDEEIAS